MKHHSKNFHSNLTETEQSEYSYLHRMALFFAVLIGTLIAFNVSAQCYTQQSEHGLLVRGAYSFHYGNNFIGNNFSMGYSIGAIGVMVGYHEFRIGQDTARQSVGVTLLHDLNRGKVVGTLFLTHGTRNYTEAGIMGRLTWQTPLYLSISTQSVQIGLLVKL